MEGRADASGRPCRSAVWVSWLGAVALATLGFVGTGCGRSEPPRPSGGPMGAAPHGGGGGENHPPVIQRLSITPASPAPGDHIRALATASDPDGNPVSVRYVWTLDGQTLDETGPEIAPSALAPGARIQVVAVASDGRLESQPVQAEATAMVPTAGIASIRLDPAPEVRPGESVVATVEMSGVSDGVELHYQWLVNDQAAPQTTERFDTTGLHRGDRIAVRVTPVKDDVEGDAVRSVDIAVANSPPKIVSQPSGTLTDGSFRYEVKAQDPDGDTGLRFGLDHGPAGMTIDPVLGVVTWRPTAAQVGRHEAEVVVSDGRGGETHQKFELTLSDDSGSTAASSAPASGGAQGSDDPGEPAAAPGPAPTRYRRSGHYRRGPAAPAAPAPAGEEPEGDTRE